MNNMFIHDPDFFCFNKFRDYILMIDARKFN